MNFYDNINNLVASFKKTEEYLEYKKLKEELKTNEDTYKMLKDFKDKQNEECRKLLECEMKINIILADLQKSMGEAIEELVKF